MSQKQTSEMDGNGSQTREDSFRILGKYGNCMEMLEWLSW